jgi:hypothetical protein
LKERGYIAERAGLRKGFCESFVRVEAKRARTHWADTSGHEPVDKRS